MKNNKNQKSLGILFGLIGMGTYGMYSVYAHYFVKSFDLLIFAGLTSLIGSLPLLIRSRIKGNQKYILQDSKYFTSLFAIAVISGVATMLFFLGTSLTSGINTGLLAQIEPIYAVIIAYFILGEKRRKREIGAILTMVIGSGVVVFKGFTPPNLGDLFILAAPIFYQLSHVVSKRVIGKLSDIHIISTARLFYGGIIMTVIGIIWHPTAILSFLSFRTVIVLIAFGFILRTLDTVFWYSALERLPLSIVSALLPVALLVSFIGSIVILKEVPTAQQYIGLIAIMSGLMWIGIVHLNERS